MPGVDHGIAAHLGARNVRRRQLSGGTLMVWLLVCEASISVPAAMRPITGTATGRSPSSALPLLVRNLPDCLR
jgi:hypothetical protein